MDLVEDFPILDDSDDASNGSEEEALQDRMPTQSNRTVVDPVVVIEHQDEYDNLTLESDTNASVESHSHPPRKRRTPALSKLDRTIRRRNHCLGLLAGVIRLSILSTAVDQCRDLKAMLLSCLPMSLIDRCTRSPCPPISAVEDLYSWFSGLLSDSAFNIHTPGEAFSSLCPIDKVHTCIEAQLSGLLKSSRDKPDSELPQEVACLLFVTLCRALPWEVRLCYDIKPGSSPSATRPSSVSEESTTRLDCPCRQFYLANPPDLLIWSNTDKDDERLTKATLPLPELKPATSRLSRKSGSLSPDYLPTSKPSLWVEVACLTDSETSSDESSSPSRFWKKIYPALQGTGSQVPIPKRTRAKNDARTYVVGVWPDSGSNTFFIKDLTRKYSSNWERCKRQRVSGKQLVWWRELLRLVGTSREMLCLVLVSQSAQWPAGRSGAAPQDDADDPGMGVFGSTTIEVPSTLADAKNNPKYCVEKHLLKHEMLHPVGPEHSVGKIIVKSRGKSVEHLVYPRDNIQRLCSLDRWRRMGRQIKDGEQPVSMTARRGRSQLKIALFGEWQTEPMDRPVAREGKIPVNPFGNVEVMEGCQLPIGTVYLDFPRIVTSAKATGVEYALAVVGCMLISNLNATHNSVHHSRCTKDGFRFARGGSVPNFKGIVILEKDQGTVLEAYRKQEEKRQANYLSKVRRQAAKDWHTLLRAALVHRRIDGAGFTGRRVA